MKPPRFLAPLALGLCAAALALVGCNRQTESVASAASQPAAPAKIKLGFLVKQPEEPWFQYEWKGAERAGAKHDFEVLKYGVQDSEKVMAAIDNLAVAGAQGFVICTPDVRMGPAIVARAKLKGLKLVTVDDQFVGPDGKFMTDVAYLGMSASKIGYSVGEALLAEAKRRGWPADRTAACIVTFEELDTARERTDGAIAALSAAGFPADRVFKAAQKTTDIPGSFDAASILLTRKPDVKYWLVAGMNDNAVLGAVRALEQRGFTADNAVGIGINGTDCISELRKPKATPFFGSMLVSAPFEGYRTAELLHDWVKNGTVPPAETRTPGILITRETFEEILRREGITE
jgi:L-arabinose transport system substrate-binding protein